MTPLEVLGYIGIALFIVFIFWIAIKLDAVGELIAAIVIALLD